jgi:hypothetical protein
VSESRMVDATQPYKPTTDDHDAPLADRPWPCVGSCGRVPREWAQRQPAEGEGRVEPARGGCNARGRPRSRCDTHRAEAATAEHATCGETVRGKGHAPRKMNRKEQ